MSEKTKQPDSPDDEGPSSGPREKAPQKPKPVNAKKALDFSVESTHDDHELFEEAKKLMHEEQYRADVLKRLSEWLSTEESVDAVAKFVSQLPQGIISPSETSWGDVVVLLENMETSSDPQTLLTNAILDAKVNLQRLDEEILRSSFIERICGERSECVKDRASILSLMTKAELKQIGESFDLDFSEPRRHAEMVKQLAEALTDAKDKPVMREYLPFPSLEYLLKLHENDEFLKSEFTRLAKYDPNGMEFSCSFFLVS